MSSIQDQLKAKYAGKFNEAVGILNTEQQAAVNAIEGPVMVIAGPGTGKTQILAVRIGKILETQEIKAHNLLCLTFTDAATIAMRKRLVSIIGPEGHKVHIYTFHGFCNQVIQENLGYFGNYRALEALSDLEKIDIYKEILEALPVDHILSRPKGNMMYEKKRLENLFSMMKRENLKLDDINRLVDDFLERDKESETYICKRKSTNKKTNVTYLKGDFRDDHFEKQVKKFDELRAGAVLFDEYEKIMHRLGRYDYADMILWVLSAFNANEDILATYQERYQYFLVDEYQDTNGAQNEILNKLINFMDIAPNVFVVGDDDQAIYKFQGANLNNIRNFKKQYNPLTVILEKNYRSNQDILDSATALINYNTERIIKDDDINATKKLIGAGPHMKEGTAPVIKSFKNVSHEQAHIVERLEQMHTQNENLNEVAIIYRKHAQVEKLVEVLEKKNIPLNIRKKVDILKLPLIKNILNILIYLQSEYDKPNSDEKRLFEMMHYHFFEVDPRDIAKIALHCRKASYSNPAHWRDVIADKKLLNTLDLKNTDMVIRVSDLINKWVSDIANVTLQILFESILNEGHILQYIISSPDKTWLLQVISTFFDIIKDESTKKSDLNLADFLEMLDKMDQAELPLQINKIVNSKNGVHFITAHSAKGLEFDKVFMIGCNKEIWDTSPSNYNQYKYPDSVNADVDTNVEDERRLFFVAMTRAKIALQISFSEKKENGKDLNASQFVDEILGMTDLEVIETEVSEDVINEFQFYTLLKQNKAVQLIDHDLIDKVLDGYKLSVTGLNKYLKCAVTFYFETILRVPTARNKYMGFGRAIHRAFQVYYEDIMDDKNPGLKEFIAHFVKGMVDHKSHFTNTEYKELLAYGELIMDQYYKEHLEKLVPLMSYKLEEKIDNAEYKGVPIKGVLDNVEIHKDYIHVVDYKTGNGFKPETMKKVKKPSASQELGGDYWRQIVFYKMLVDSDKKHNWNMVSGEIDFVEPKRNTSEFKKEKIVVSPLDIEIVGEQLVETWQNIHDHKFGQLCEDEKCYWCNFVRNDFVFNGDYEIDLMEEVQDS